MAQQDRVITLEEIANAVKRLVKIDGVLIVMPCSVEEYTTRASALAKAEIYRVAQECKAAKENNGAIQTANNRNQSRH